MIFLQSNFRSIKCSSRRRSAGRLRFRPQEVRSRQRQAGNRGEKLQETTRCCRIFSYRTNRFIYECYASRYIYRCTYDTIIYMLDPRGSSLSQSRPQVGWSQVAKRSDGARHGLLEKNRSRATEPLRSSPVDCQKWLQKLPENTWTSDLRYPDSFWHPLVSFKTYFDICGSSSSSQVGEHFARITVPLYEDGGLNWFICWFN